jgi:Rrf2 family protein
MAQQQSSLVSAKFLVEKLEISDKYLRSLMTQLAKCGLIHSIQGRDGGYKITKALDEIYLIEIIEAVDKLDKYMGCVLGFDECSDANPCALHAKWNSIKKETLTFLKTTTLKEIINNDQILKH